jgi:hypothetical protein
VIVTLEFTVKDDFAGNSIVTSLSFTSAAVSAPGSIKGATTAPGLPVSITLSK